MKQIDSGMEKMANRQVDTVALRAAMRPALNPAQSQARTTPCWRLATLLAALCLGATPARAQDVDLGTAAGYAGFILGSASAMSHVEGRLAVARDLDTDQLDVASAQPDEATEQASLVVGGKISAYRRGDIWRSGGRKGYGAYRGDKGDTGGALDLRHEPGNIDFDAEAVWLTMLSADLSLRPRGVVLPIPLFHTVTLIGSFADLEVFQVDAGMLAKDRILLLQNIKPDARIVINVAADAQRQVSLSWNQDVLKNLRTRVLYNLPDAEVLRFEGGRVWGSILAPYACVQGSGGRIDGSVIAGSWNSGAEIGYAPFEAGP